MNAGTTTLIASIAALAVVVPGFAEASVMHEGGAISYPPASVVVGASPFESGVEGCIDPMAWVWHAPRAERVAMPVPAGTLCEIGAAGCDRLPETSADLVNFSDAPEEWLVAESICDLKLKQHGVGDAELPFDSASCLEAERAPVAESLPITRPAPPRRSGPVCSEFDTTCQSLPPTLPTLVAEVFRASAGVTSAVPEPRYVEVIALRRGLRSLLGPATGVERRVERPPAA